MFSVVVDYANGTYSQGTIANCRSASSEGDYRPITKADYTRVGTSYTKSSTADYSERRTQNTTSSRYIVCLSDNFWFSGGGYRYASTASSHDFTTR